MGSACHRDGVVPTVYQKWWYGGSRFSCSSIDSISLLNHDWTGLGKKLWRIPGHGCNLLFQCFLQIPTSLLLFTINKITLNSIAFWTSTPKPWQKSRHRIWKKKKSNSLRVHYRCIGFIGILSYINDCPNNSRLLCGHRRYRFV